MPPGGGHRPWQRESDSPIITRLFLHIHLLSPTFLHIHILSLTFLHIHILSLTSFYIYIYIYIYTPIITHLLAYIHIHLIKLTSFYIYTYITTGRLICQRRFAECSDFEVLAHAPGRSNIFSNNVLLVIADFEMGSKLEISPSLFNRQ